MSEAEDLNKLVNASGFAFQLGVEHAVRLHRGHSWRVVSREHPWRTAEGSGFIDLVLALGIVTGVVECKRTRDGIWVFLVPTGEDTQKVHSRVHWVAGTKDGRPLFGAGTFEHLPPSYVSSFCIVRGSGENDRPLLERLCATLLSSADALADEKVGILQSKGHGWKGFYLPIVVTSAELRVCRMAPSNVDLGTGTITETAFESVPFIRFQKAFGNPLTQEATTTDLTESAREQERTVWIVQAKSLDEFLAKFKEPPFKDPYPWDLALAAAERTI
jgi:hypothetical protein